MNDDKITSIIAELELDNLAAQTLLNQSVVGYCLTTEDFIVLWTNVSFNQIFGYSDNEIKGKSIDIVVKDNPLKKSENLSLTREHSEIKDLSSSVVHKSGRRFFSTINITKVKYDNAIYYFFGFPVYSKRVGLIIEMMKNSFSYLINGKQFFLVETDINHPYNIKVITRECYNILGRDFSEMQSKSVLLFLKNESRILLSETLETLIGGNYDHYIACLDWKKDNSSVIRTRVIIQHDKAEESFRLLTIPVFLENDNQLLEESESSKSGLSSLTNQTHQSSDTIHEKMIDFLEKQINEIDDQVREIDRNVAEMNKEIEWIIKTTEGLSVGPLSDTLEEKVVNFLNRYKIFVIPGLSLVAIVILGVISVERPNNPYVQKIEKIIVDILGKNKDK